MIIVARKTIKGLEVIITDLEKRLNEQNKINVELHNKISQMQPDDKFENSPIYHQMVKEIEKLKAIIRLNEINTKSKEDTIKRDRDTLQKLLKEIEELKSNNVVNKLKNERGAGRKEMFNEEQKARVKMLRLQDKSYRAIAKDMNCSVATVHKIINEQHPHFALNLIINPPHDAEPNKSLTRTFNWAITTDQS